LIRAYALIAIDVKANSKSTILAELVNSLAEQSIINWESVIADVGFLDANNCDWLCCALSCWTQRGDEVVKQQIKTLGYSRNF